MAATRLIVLGVAVAAAVGAGVIGKNLATPPPAAPQQKAGPSIETTDVLALSKNVAMGEKLDGALTWQAWPKSGLAEGFITRDAKPDALAEFGPAIARMSLLVGEPVRESKLAKGREMLSTLLPSGKRALAIGVSADTSAGGFILPNDFVDVVMVRKNANQAASSGLSGYQTETILKNVKVLAIDQTIQEDEKGEKTRIGSTATLELAPEQVMIVAAAQQVADRLTLALRSVADAQEKPTEQADWLIGAGTVRLIKSGEISEVGARK